MIKLNPILQNLLPLEMCYVELSKGYVINFGRDNRFRVVNKTNNFHYFTKHIFFKSLDFVCICCHIAQKREVKILVPSNILRSLFLSNYHKFSNEFINFLIKFLKFGRLITRIHALTT